MKLQMFTVLDKLAAVYATPFFAINASLAQRDFAYACKDPNSKISRNPEDFSLWHVAEYDDSSGLVHALDKPSFICDAIAYCSGE